LNQRGELVRRVAVLTAEADEIVDSGEHRSALWRAGDADPVAAAELEEPLVAQQPKRPQDGIGVDADHRGEIPSRREALTRFRFAVGDRPPDLPGDLVVEQRRVSAIYLKVPDDATEPSIAGANERRLVGLL
jgi:hypothetical protein